MENHNSKIKSFTDLLAWREAHGLVLVIYKVTEDFPPKEVFGISNQMRRAAVSVSSNIAEGFGRNTDKDKRNFYSMASGSLTELQNQLLIARDVGYLSKTDFQKIAEQSVRVHKLINGLKKLRFNNV